MGQGPAKVIPCWCSMCFPVSVDGLNAACLFHEEFGLVSAGQPQSSVAVVGLAPVLGCDRSPVGWWPLLAATESLWSNLTSNTAPWRVLVS